QRPQRRARRRGRDARDKGLNPDPPATGHRPIHRRSAPAARRPAAAAGRGRAVCLSWAHPLEVCMPSLPRPFPWFAFLMMLLLGPPLAAQKDGRVQYVSPDKFERETKDDAQGLAQWVPWKNDEKCPNCNGAKVVECPHCARFEDNKKCIECQLKKKAPCRACGGLGVLPDPLDKVLCPGCMGAGFFPCIPCHGGGQIKIQGSGEHKFDCLACKGEGGFKCTVCNGSRFVEAATFKPSLKECTNVQQLTKTREQLDETLKALGSFAPDGKNSR